MNKFIPELDTVQLSKEYVMYDRDDVVNGILRFGQYICNKYLMAGESYSQIFYEENDDRAFLRIFNDITQER